MMRNTVEPTNTQKRNRDRLAAVLYQEAIFQELRRADTFDRESDAAVAKILDQRFGLYEIR